MFGNCKDFFYSNKSSQLFKTPGFCPPHQRIKWTTLTHSKDALKHCPWLCYTYPCSCTSSTVSRGISSYMNAYSIQPYCQCSIKMQTLPFVLAPPFPIPIPPPIPPASLQWNFSTTKVIIQVSGKDACCMAKSQLLPVAPGPALCSCCCITLRLHIFGRCVADALSEGLSAVHELLWSGPASSCGSHPLCSATECYHYKGEKSIAT